jgi:hypothetical protein
MVRIRKIALAFCCVVTSVVASPDVKAVPANEGNPIEMRPATIGEVIGWELSRQQLFLPRVIETDRQGRATKVLFNGEVASVSYDVAGKMESFRTEREVLRIRFSTDHEGNPLLRIFSEDWTEQAPVRLVGVGKFSAEAEAFRDTFPSIDAIEPSKIVTIEKKKLDSQLLDRLGALGRRQLKFGDDNDGVGGGGVPGHGGTITPQRLCELKCERDHANEVNVCETLV